MLHQWEIDVTLRRFRGREHLMLIYLTDKHIFAVVSHILPQLPIAQVTRDEMERIANTDEPEANLAALISARCTVSADQAAEIKVLKEIGDETKELKTKDQLATEVRRIVNEMKQEEAEQKAEEIQEENTEKAKRKDLFDVPDTGIVVETKIQGVVEVEVESITSTATPVTTTEGIKEKTVFSDLSALLKEE